jgi:hypothetical protein
MALGLKIGLRDFDVVAGLSFEFACSVFFVGLSLIGMMIVARVAALFLVLTKFDEVTLSILVRA